MRCSKPRSRRHVLIDLDLRKRRHSSERRNEELKAMIRRLLLAASIALAFTHPAGAQPPTTAAVPENVLGYFAGTWDIVATTPGSADVTNYVYEVGPWIQPNWLSGQGRSVPAGEESRDVWGRDGASGELMRIIFADNGTFAVVRSAGWQGNKLVLEGDARSPGGVVRVRETIERLGDNQFLATWEAYREGAWSPYSVERVTRRGS